MSTFTNNLILKKNHSGRKILSPNEDSFLSVCRYHRRQCCGKHSQMSLGFSLFWSRRKRKANKSAKYPLNIYLVDLEDAF